MDRATRHDMALTSALRKVLIELLGARRELFRVHAVSQIDFDGSALIPVGFVADVAFEREVSFVAVAILLRPTHLPNILSEYDAGRCRQLLHLSPETLCRRQLA